MQSHPPTAKLNAQDSACMQVNSHCVYKINHVQLIWHISYSYFLILIYYGIFKFMVNSCGSQYQMVGHEKGTSCFLFWHSYTQTLSETPSDPLGKKLLILSGSCCKMPHAF